jgi:hypothetical protein
LLPKIREEQSMSAESKVTIDHDEIRQWVEQRGGHPSCVRGTGGKGDAGLLRIDFPGFSGEGKLEEIPWEEFFEKFDENNLAFLHQDKTAGGQESRFNKLVSRDTVEQAAKPRKPSARAASTRTRSATQARSGAGARSKSAVASKSTPTKKTATKKAGASKPAASTSPRSASPRKASAPARKSGAKKAATKTTARKTTRGRSATR